MYITRLALKNFRNYAEAEIAPGIGLNILYGKNAQGKTNVVEAVYYLSTGKSFRTSRDMQMIKFDTDYAHITATFKTHAGNNQMQAVIKKDGSKRFKINAMPVKKLGHLFGNFTCIAFTPEDIKAVKEAPALRRQLIDMEIAKIKPAYFFKLKDYYKTLADKNALLKKAIGDNQKRLLYVYNEQLAAHAKSIIGLRETFLQELKPEYDDTYALISGGQHKASIKYKATVGFDNIEQDMLEKLNAALPREMDYKQSMIGPHKEDFVFYLDDKDAKFFGSQGQQRTIMLAFKLAVLNLVKKRTGESPVLVLDDVFSELDFSRQQQLTKVLSASQVFITTAVPINVKENYTAFVVQNGRIKNG